MFIHYACFVLSRYGSHVTTDLYRVCMCSCVCDQMITLYTTNEQVGEVRPKDQKNHIFLVFYNRDGNFARQDEVRGKISRNYVHFAFKNCSVFFESLFSITFYRIRHCIVLCKPANLQAIMLITCTVTYQLLSLNKNERQVINLLLNV